MPDAVSNRLAREIVCYGRSVVHEGWPRMEDGTLGDTINPWAVALFRSLEVAEPDGPTEEAA